jgi:hypothetical protein
MFMPNSPSPPSGIAKREGLLNAALSLFATHHRITRACKNLKREAFVIPVEVHRYDYLLLAAGKKPRDGDQHNSADGRRGNAVD